MPFHSGILPAEEGAESIRESVAAREDEEVAMPVNDALDGVTPVVGNAILVVTFGDILHDKNPEALWSMSSLAKVNHAIAFELFACPQDPSTEVTTAGLPPVRVIKRVRLVGDAPQLFPVAGFEGVFRSHPRERFLQGVTENPDTGSLPEERVDYRVL